MGSSVHCKDIDVNDGTSYLRASRARQFEAQRAAQLDDPPMTRELTQFMMAYELTTINAFTNNQDEVTVGKRSRNDMYYTDYSDYGGSLYALREAAQERYWYHMSPEERKRARDESSRSPKFEFSSNLVAIRQGWQKEWDNAALHPDHFRNNHMDNLAAENVWNLVEGLGIFVAIDVNRQVIFADVERLFKTLWDQELLIVLIRCFDMWAYFTPLPAPEPCGLAAENYFLKVHPELDMSKASVEKLPNARSCVAHYGCLASSNDTEGQRIFTTLDTRCSRDDCMAYSADIFPRFAEAALGKATEMIRFLMKPLDRAFYEESLQIHSDLDSEEKITTSDEDFLNHFTLGVNGYVGRHRNIKGCTGGLTGICSFGDYLEGKARDSPQGIGDQN
jgi:hypothetical protein